jgi:hypothetical protein
MAFRAVNKAKRAVGKRAISAAAITVAIFAACKLITSIFRRGAAATIPQGVPDNQLSEVVAKLRKSMLSITWGNHFVGWGLALDDTTVRICNHFRYNLDGSVRALHAHAVGGQGPVDIPLNDDNMVYNDRVTDSAIYKVKKTWRPSITGHFRDPKKGFGTSAWLVTPAWVRPVSILNDQELLVYPDKATGLGRSVRVVGRHNDKHTVAGDCGALLVSMERGSPLLGVHTAKTSHGFPGVFTNVHTLASTATTEPQSLETWAGKSVVEFVSPIFNPARTKLVPASSAGAEGGPFKFPTNQMWTGGEPALRAAVASLRAEDAWLPPEDPKQAMHRECLRYVIQDTHRLNGPPPGRMATLEEAIFGDKSLGIKPLNASKSPGYPLLRKHLSRKELWNQETRTIEPAFRAYMEDIVATLNSGGSPKVIYRDFLKDECRKLGKPARLIRGSPVEFTIIGRMLFMWYVSRFAATRSHHGMCLGFNPFSQEATWSHHAMMKLSENWTDHDYKEFDHNHSPDTLETIVKEVGAGLPYAPQHWVDWYARNTAHCVAIGGDNAKSDRIYENHGCTPTGNFLTTIINMLVNKAILINTWISLHGGDWASVLTFHRDTFFQLYGDDGRGSSKGDLLNTHTIRPIAEGLRYTVTDGNGDSPGRALAPWDQTSFIGRYDRVSEDGYVFYCLQDAILDGMLDWRKSSTPDRVFLEGVCRAILIEAGALDYGNYLHRATTVHNLVLQHNLDIPASIPNRVSYNIWQSHHCSHIPDWDLEEA